MRKLALSLALMSATPSLAATKLSLIEKCRAVLARMTDSLSAPLVNARDVDVEDIKKIKTRIREDIHGAILTLTQNKLAKEKMYSVNDYFKNFIDSLEIPSKQDPKLSRFVPVGFAGLGGNALVVKAWDRNLNRWVAVKIHLSAGGAHKVSAVREFQVSRTAEAKLGDSSPIPHQHDTFTHKNAEYNVMEYVAGDSLNVRWTNFLKDSIRGTNALKKEISILSDAGEQIQKLHDLGYVHLDLKPSNFMQGENGVKLIDNESALPLIGDTGATHAPIATISDVYSAKELRQAYSSSKPIEVTTAADAFSYATMIEKFLQSYVETLRKFDESILTKRELKNIDTIGIYLDRDVIPSLNSDPTKRATVTELSASLKRLLDSLE